MPGALPPPSPADLGPLLGDSGGLDTPSDPTDSEPGEYDAAAMAAVGTKAKATALHDAITACLREHGLISDSDDSASEGEGSDSGPPAAAPDDDGSSDY